MRYVSRRALLGVLVVCLVSVAAAVFAQTSSAAGTPMTVQVVLENPDYETLAIDPAGSAYGVSVSADNGIWKSTDHGANWTQVLTLPANQHVKYITALASGTLLAHVDTGQLSLFRSADQGANWARVLDLPVAPVFYTTLTPDSIAEGGGFLWLGTYNTGQTTPNDNYIYRSADDGVDWAVVNTSTTHRHIHGLRYNNGKLYAFIGDADGDGVWVSSDNGVTLTPLCTEFGCVAIDAAFDPANAFMIFGTDNFTQQNKIVKVALSDGARSVVQDIPYTSFSTFRLDDEHVPDRDHPRGRSADRRPEPPSVRLLRRRHLVPGRVSRRRSRAPDSRVGLEVHYAYSNGDFPILVNGHGTLVGRLVPATAPANTALPTVSGTARVGQALTGSNGTWTGSAPITFENQWRLCNGAGASCADIAGATEPTYTPVAGDVGKTVRLRVTATNSVSSVSADSAATAAVLVASPLANTVLPSCPGPRRPGRC